jgi:hypothetical protein
LGISGLRAKDLWHGKGLWPSGGGRALLSKFGAIFFYFAQVGLAVFNLAILFGPFGGKVFDGLGGIFVVYTRDSVWSSHI